MFQCALEQGGRTPARLPRAGQRPKGLQRKQHIRVLLRLGEGGGRPWPSHQAMTVARTSARVMGGVPGSRCRASAALAASLRALAGCAPPWKYSAAKAFSKAAGERGGPSPGGVRNSSASGRLLRRSAAPSCTGGCRTGGGGAGASLPVAGGCGEARVSPPREPGTVFCPPTPPSRDPAPAPPEPPPGCAQGSSARLRG